MIDLIDTHCHLNFDSYDDDRQEVVERAANAGVQRVIIPAIDLQSAKDAIRLSRQFPGVYVAIGIHPNSSTNVYKNDFKTLVELAREPKAIAIGEIGLDYYRNRSPKSRQLDAFQAQLVLAAELELPVIIHNRDAGDDVMALLEEWVRTTPESLRTRPGVLHSFSAPRDIADRALDIGFYLGFTGPITFKNADALRQIATVIPQNRIVVETDGPFLTPVPYRGKRNEPAYIPHIVERLASLRNVTVEAMAQTTTDNAIALFNLPRSD